MPADIVNTALERYDPTVAVPVKGDSLTAASVRAPFRSIVNRTRWIWARIEEVIGKFTPMSAVIPTSIEAVITASNTIEITGHGLSDTDPVRILPIDDATLPDPLFATNVYYVVNATADTIKLAATSGGSAIDLTTAGSGTLYLVKVTTPKVFLPATSASIAGRIDTVLAAKADLVSAGNVFAGSIYVTGPITAAGGIATTLSNRGVLAANETLALGYAIYGYDEPTANRVITLPAGTTIGQTITLRSTVDNPTYSIEWKYLGVLRLGMPAGPTSRREWGVLRWDGTTWDSIMRGAGMLG